MFKAKNGELPTVLQNELTKRNHKYETRNIKNTFRLPLCNTRYSRYSISYRGPRIWNKYSNHISNTESIIVFKTRAKTLLNSSDINIELFF